MRKRGISSVPNWAMTESRPLWPPGPPRARSRRRPRGKSQIVERDQDFLRLNFVELRNCEHWIPAAIHEAQRLDQKHSSTFRGECVPFCRFFPSRSKLRCQLVDDHKSDVVPRSRVLRAGISETGDEPDCCFVHARAIENPKIENRKWITSFLSPLKLFLSQPEPQQQQLRPLPFSR